MREVILKLKSSVDKFGSRQAAAESENNKTKQRSEKLWKIQLGEGNRWNIHKEIQVNKENDLTKI